jgi:glycosyltransferase involved in cell wall biosynthesis
VLTYLREFRPDVVHCHDRYANTFVTPLARISGAPFIIASRRWWTAMPRPIYRAGNQLAYRLSHCVLANSEATAQLMVRQEFVDPARIVVISNFVDEIAFAPLDETRRREALRGFGVPEGAAVIASVALFRPEKDLESLIDAIALIGERTPRPHLLLIGSGPCEADLRSFAARKGVAERVHFPGFLSSPPNPHAYADISVLCSLHEGFPNSVIEAMAAGKPVVATDVGGIPDAVEANVTGLLVPPASPQRLAAAIERLLADRELSSAMGERGLRKAQTDFSVSAVINRLSELYVAQKTGGGPTRFGTRFASAESSDRAKMAPRHAQADLP